MRFFITGIAGFLASHIADALLADGYEVSGNDNLICGNMDNIPAGVTFYNVDCRDFDGMKKAITGCDVLVHCAATAAEGLSVFSPSFITKNIYEASVATFSAGIACGVKRIVTMSSMARYGKQVPPFYEEYTPRPVDPYGIAKVAAEDTLKILCSAHNVKWAIATPHNLIGPRQQISAYRNVCSIFLNRLYFGMPIYIYGDGEQKRSFSPVKDCIHSLVRMVHGVADGEVVNIGPDGNEITINELLKICEDVTGKKSEVVYLPPRLLTDNVKEAHCSSAKARRLLGYEPQQDLIPCIQEMYAMMKPLPFAYDMPLEIDGPLVPRTWKEQLQ
jgi:UDP-glucose 4-epimerase